MAEVVDTFELRHVSTTYSKIRMEIPLLTLIVGVMLPDLDQSMTPQFYDLKSDVDAGKLIRIGHAFARDGSYILGRGSGNGRGCLESMRGKLRWFLNLMVLKSEA